MNVNKNLPQTSVWSLWLAGSSPLLKRLFVIGLVAASLAVWAVTVISVSVLRHEGQGGLQTAQAALASQTPRLAPSATERPKGEDEFYSFGPVSPDGVTVSESGAVAANLAINLPGRNPFEPLAAYFPAAKPKTKTAVHEVGGGPGGKSVAADSTTAAETAARELSFVDGLKIRGTLVKGGRTLVIIDDGVYGEGDTIGGRLVIGEINRQKMTARGRELARQFVVLRGSVKEYVVEIKP